MEKEEKIKKEEKVEKEEKSVEIKKMNIFEKMMMITSDLETVEKKLNVQVSKTSSYKAVGEKDILDAVKPLEKKYRIYSYPLEREIIENDKLVASNEYGTKTSLFLRLKVKYRFYNIDNTNEYIDIISYADGIDTGDKATGKAMTYADKYALMKAYKISTGDDPDKEPSPEQGYEKPKASQKQIDTIVGKLSPESLQTVIARLKIEKIEDISKEDASKLIGTIFGDK